MFRPDRLRLRQVLTHLRKLRISRPASHFCSIDKGSWIRQRRITRKQSRHHAGQGTSLKNLRRIICKHFWLLVKKMNEAPNDCCCRWAMTPQQIQRCRGKSKARSQTFMRAKTSQRKRISGIASPSAASSSSARPIDDEELRLPFFANGDALYRRYADFLIASRKPEYALQLLDIGRARTLAEGLGLDKEKPNIRPEQPGDVQAVARKLDSTILFYSLGPKKFLVVGHYAASHPHFPAPRSVGHRNSGAQLSERNPEIDRPPA